MSSDPAAEDLSQSEEIRRELVAQFNSGQDPTAPKARARICHAVADKLHPKYSHLDKDTFFSSVSRQWKKALEEFTGKQIEPTLTSSKVGGGKVEVEIPAPRQQEQQPQAEPQQQEPQRVIRTYATMDELKESLEYQQQYLEYYVLFEEAAQIEAAFGMQRPQPIALTVQGKEVVYDPIDQLAQKWAIATVKYGWEFPEWLNKVILFGSTGLVFVAPILAQLGILGDKQEKKKDEPEKSDEPLA